MARTAQSIGLLGGTFNPIHYGHLILAEEARIQHQLDLVLLIPNFIPPHRRQEKDLAPAKHRHRMVMLAVKSNRFFKACDIEIKRKGPSYTVDTVLQLKKKHPNNRYFLISGSDSFLIHPWRELPKLLDALEGLLIADRRIGAQAAHSGEGSRAVHEKIKGVNVLNVEMAPIGISSTEIRGRIRKGIGIRYRVPESVEHYIERNLLYR